MPVNTEKKPTIHTAEISFNLDITSSPFHNAPLRFASKDIGECNSAGSDCTKCDLAAEKNSKIPHKENRNGKKNPVNVVFKLDAALNMHKKR